METKLYIFFFSGLPRWTKKYSSKTFQGREGRISLELSLAAPYCIHTKRFRLKLISINRLTGIVVVLVPTSDGRSRIIRTADY